MGLFLCKKTIHIHASPALGWSRESGFAPLGSGWPRRGLPLFVARWRKKRRLLQSQRDHEYDQRKLLPSIEARYFCDIAT